MAAVLVLVAGADPVAPARTGGPGPGPPAPGTAPTVAASLDRTDAAARAAVSDAAALAVREADRSPTPGPGEATYGGVLEGPTPARDRLRLRIYLAARRALSAVEVRVGGLRGRASLPPAGNATQLRAALDRVRIRRDAGLLGVWLRNVTVAVVRDGRRVATDHRTIRVAVRVPPARPGPATAGRPGDDSHLSRPALVAGMFHEELRELDGRSVADLRREYATNLADAVESVGLDAAVDRTGLDRGVVAAVAVGDVEGLSLSDAAALAALAEGTPDAGTIEEIACDHLLLGMSTAVLDVDTVAGNVAVDLTPKEVQQKLERRAPMTFEEYVQVQHFVAERQGEAF